MAGTQLKNVSAPKKIPAKTEQDVARASPLDT
jgi:hypothetical protein